LEEIVPLLERKKHANIYLTLDLGKMQEIIDMSLEFFFFIAKDEMAASNSTHGLTCNTLAVLNSKIRNMVEHKMMLGANFYIV